MTSYRPVEDRRPDALFWLGIAAALLIPLRMTARTLEAPLTLRLSLGIALITILVALAGVLVVRRLRGRVVAARSAMGVGGVAVFLLCFWLFDGGGPVVNVIGGLIGLSAVSAALFASFWD